MNIFTRHQSPLSKKSVVLAGLGGLVGIALTGALTAFGTVPLLMAPFGASCVLLFTVPDSPLSQPANVIGGHVISTLVGLVLRMMLPDQWWAWALAVGLAIALMAALRVTHPPAGADPLVVFAANPGFEYLLFPVLTGSCLLVVIAGIFHKASGTLYPRKK
nr:HPP family protein [uncultured Desulfovibrio sp.]